MNARIWCRRLVVCSAGLLGMALHTANAQQAAPDYILHPGDSLEVAVWQEVELTKTVVVRPDGKISFPLAGEMVAAGRTPVQVKTDIETRLKTYIPEPVVTVSVADIKGNSVYVIGQVNKPGAYVMNPQLTVLQALSVAGGTTPYAALGDIAIIRRGGGKQSVLPFKYGEVSKGRNLEQNVVLEAGDVIVVP